MIATLLPSYTVVVHLFDRGSPQTVGTVVGPAESAGQTLILWDGADAPTAEWTGELALAPTP